MIKVKIKKAIALKGCGFVDIDGKQDLFPRDKNGKIDVDKVYTVEATPFIELKIASGELVLVSRDQGKAENK